MTKDGFSRNKHVCRNKNMLVATKIRLVAAPANDNDHVAVKYVETGAGVNHLAFGHCWCQSFGIWTLPPSHIPNDHVAVKYVETSAGVNHLAFGHSHPVTYPMIMLLSNMWRQVLVSIIWHLDTPTQSHTQ